MHYICEAVDHIGFKSYLMMEEAWFEEGEVELLVTPTYNEHEAYKFLTRESAEEATKEWLMPNLTWTVKEIP